MSAYEHELRNRMMSPLPILLKFEADWCGPCKRLSQVIASMQLPIELRAVNIDKHRVFAQGCGVRAVPTMQIYSKGYLLAEQTGVITSQELLAWIERALV